MNKKSVSLIVVSLVIAALFIASCSSSTSPTLTSTADDCTYSGPKSIQKDATLTWVIQGDLQKASAYVVVTLNEGKTIDDLASLPTTDQPSWVNALYWEGAEFGNQTKTKQFNLGANAAYKGEPLYLVCFYGDEQIGQVGPIKVK